MSEVQGLEETLDQKKEKFRQRLVEIHHALNQIYRGLPETKLDQHTTEEGWTTRQTLAHLIDTETRMTKLGLRAVAGKSTTLPDGFDFNKFNVQQLATKENLDIESLLAELARSQQQTLAFVDNLKEDQLNIMLEHPAIKGPIDVRKLLGVIIYHETTHLAEIKLLAAE